MRRREQLTVNLFQAVCRLNKYYAVHCILSGRIGFLPLSFPEGESQSRGQRET